jgi:hypothetical protein
MRCPDCHKVIGRFDGANPPRCPRTGRLGFPLTARRFRGSLAGVVWVRAPTMAAPGMNTTKMTRGARR